MSFRTIIEPFRIHSVEPVRMTSETERRDPRGRLRDPDAPGSRCRKDLLHGDRRAGKGRPEQHALRHDSRQHRGDRAEAVDLPIPEALDPTSLHPFKGNIDLAALDGLLSGRAGDVPAVFVTVTNNSGGGQPVSLENLRGARKVCGRHGVPLFLDGCFAENAWFVKQREPGHADRPVAEIVREMASLVDGMTMSAKKDGLANIGGRPALNDDEWAERSPSRSTAVRTFCAVETSVSSGLYPPALNRVAMSPNAQISRDVFMPLLRELVHREGRLRRAVVRNDRRVGVEVSEVEAAGGDPLHLREHRPLLAPVCGTAARRSGAPTGDIGSRPARRAR